MTRACEEIVQRSIGKAFNFFNNACDVLSGKQHL